MSIWHWGSETFPLSLFNGQLDIDCFTQGKIIDMAQLLGAKELQSFVANSMQIYDYAYASEVDL
jgi:hypothetical protein